MEEISNTYTSQPESGIVRSDDLIVNLECYEGPLDVLLVLAKSQKVTFKDMI